jgi:hypothetical protein
MLDSKVSEAQKKATAKWRAKNRKKNNRYARKSHARNFILEATLEELEELKDLIEKRLKGIQKDA